jgi:hypothetical protein
MSTLEKTRLVCEVIRTIMPVLAVILQLILINAMLG